MKYINIATAIKVLRPNAKWTIRGNTYEGIEDWDDGGENPPTEAEINAEIEKQEKEYDAQEYARNRVSDYPSLGDQLDMMYKDNKNSTTTHATAIEAVKAKWPKDNSGPK
jgi:hypothetical protein